MAIVERPTPALELTTGEPVVGRPLGGFTRPQATTGWKSWLTTVDHKRIGIMYGASALFFFVLGGIEAVLIRLQLAAPGQKLYSADLYNQLFTMHGVTMIFLVVIPLGAAFMNYLMPLQIGARDVAFPRLNAFSFWCFLGGGIMLNTSWFLGGGADGGWFAYAPNTGVTFSPSHGMDFYAIGLQITGIASLVGAINLVVTVLNLRAPGMTLMKMPVFTWMAPRHPAAAGVRHAGHLGGAVPADVRPAVRRQLLQRLPGRRPAAVGAPVLDLRPPRGLHPDPAGLRHRVRDHPGVLAQADLRLPVHGVLGHRHRLHGLGRVGHHMFASGMGPLSVAAFALSTMFIAVPTGVKILNWLATMWGGKLRFTTPMLFAIGLVTMFTIGGLSGVTHAVAPSDTQQTDTYYIVAHFHYVIFGGALLGFLGGMYFWWPKVFGYLLSEKLGKWHFWTILIGFNLTFGPMHILGLQGMPRRMHTYVEGYGFDFWNMASTVGAFIIAVSMLSSGGNILASWRRHRANPVDPGPDPWDARSLEWMVQSPVPAHNFDDVPTVSHLDEFWHRKYQENDEGKVVAGRHRRRGRPTGRRHRGAPALAVVLAPGARRRPAGHRLRPHLQPRPGGRRRPDRRHRRLRLGLRAGRRPRGAPRSARPRRPRRRATTAPSEASPPTRPTATADDAEPSRRAGRRVRDGRLDRRRSDEKASSDD